MKIIIALLIGLSSLAIHASPETFRALIRIQKDSDGPKILTGDGRLIPSIMGQDFTGIKVNQLTSGSEAFIEGYVDYQVTTAEGVHSKAPFLVIKSIHPVSLSELGRMEGLSEDRLMKTMQLRIEKTPYPAFAFPVSTEVASAITMTSSFLLMESLSSGAGDPSGRRELRKALIISTGVMATLVFLHEQITKP